MRFYFQAISMHSYRITNAVLSLDGKATLDDMNDFAIMWNRNRTRLIQGMGNIILLDHISIDRYRATAIYARHMRAGHAHECRGDLESGCGFRLFHRACDRL